MIGNSGGFSGFPGYTARDRRWWVRPDEPLQERVGEREPAERGAPAQPAPAASHDAELAERDRLVREAQARERDAETRERDAQARERQAVLELDRARARLERESRKEIERARRELVVFLLPVLDDLDRAIAASPVGDSMRVGVELVRSGFLDRLRTLGVERFGATGDPFDPALHEAMAAVDDPGSDGTVRVVETVSPGYRSDGEILRPAQVVVSRRLPQARVAAAYSLE